MKRPVIEDSNTIKKIQKFANFNTDGNFTKAVLILIESGFKSEEDKKNKAKS